ncbi:MAG TPA: MBL fold metallo-hydrolase [Gemmatimonadales bacterium]|nr:MBL fold metallo-hydrolase [Gemmatimonadales bacterium]
MKLTFLGTGTSFGVPQIGCQCPVCCSVDPRDKRMRASAVIQTPRATILFDTPPELRLELLAAGLNHIDAVCYTHEHADHVSGIDDLRLFTVRDRKPMPIFGPAETLDRLRQGFRYIFDDSVEAHPGTSKPRLIPEAVEPGQAFEVAGESILPLVFAHGNMRVFGYRIGRVAYVTDVKTVPAGERAALQGLDVLVLNALWWRSHPTHMSISEAVSTAQDLGAAHTYLTHLTHETGHAELEAALPPGISPAYDGLTVEVS